MKQNKNIWLSDLSHCAPPVPHLDSSADFGQKPNLHRHPHLINVVFVEQT